MSNSTLFEQTEPAFGATLRQHPTFDQQSSFDFGRNVAQNMDSFGGFHANDADYNLINHGMYDDDDMNPNFFDEQESTYRLDANMFTHNHHLPNYGNAVTWQNVNQDHSTTGKFAGAAPPSPPQSEQSNIVNSRSKQVNQHFGQITPPNESLRSPKSSIGKRQFQSQAEERDAGKLSREQRARNAANTRHSKPKKQKKSSDHGSGNEVSENDAQQQGRSLTVQREKNRVAAAKCRAKKKAGNEVKEAEAREISATHNYLTREVRELKNEATNLKSQLLLHRPGACECHGIHHYNAMQAQKLVYEAGGRNAQPMPSPSQESVSSVQSESNGSSAAYSVPNSAGGYQRPPRHPSFSGPAMQLPDGSAQGSGRTSQEFADFLHSSPGGRAGFS